MAAQKGFNRLGFGPKSLHQSSGEVIRIGHRKGNPRRLGLNKGVFDGVNLRSTQNRPAQHQGLGDVVSPAGHEPSSNDHLIGHGQIAIHLSERIAKQHIGAHRGRRPPNLWIEFGSE